jgi:hypothetical protein
LALPTITTYRYPAWVFDDVFSWGGASFPKISVSFPKNFQEKKIMNDQMRKVSEIIAYLQESSNGVFKSELQRVLPDFDVHNIAIRLAAVGMINITPTGFVVDPFGLEILDDLKTVALMIGENGRYRGELPRTKFASCSRLDDVIEILLWLDVIDDGRRKGAKKRATDFLQSC